MAVTSQRLTIVRGDTQDFDFAFLGTPLSVTFELTHPAYPFEPIVTKTLDNGISLVNDGLGIRVRIDQTDLLSLSKTLNVLTYFLRVAEGSDVTTLAAGALYVYPAG